MSSVLTMESPVGTLKLVSDGAALTHVLFVDEPCSELAGCAGDPVLLEGRRQLDRYFAGGQQPFDLPLSAQGTSFQRRVWAELAMIRYGATASYGDIATRLEMPLGGSRAVGLANGSNPIAIVVPCHRVIGSDGRLTGYAGGLERKQFLLGLESRAAAQQPLFA